jgi:acetolactate decarboxylase
MTSLRKCALLILCLVALSGSAWAQPDREVLYQTSTLDALMVGVYDGPVSFQQLGQHGDFGLGTVNALDGEMLALEGHFYQITADGVVHEIDAAAHTPFACVTFFDRDRSASIGAQNSLAELSAQLDLLLPTKNTFYAIRIDGEFPYLKCRSVPRQQRPYPGLAAAVAEQSVFEWRDLRGTIVGFRCPAYVKGVNVAGYHFHFIDATRTRGGHLLDCQVRQAEVALDLTRELRLVLPESEDFDRAPLDEAPGEEPTPAE